MTYGNFWLIACCVSYEVWWSIAFHPTKKAPFAAKLILFLITLALGIAGVSLMIGAIASTPDAGPLPIWSIALIAIGVYIALLLVSARLFHRQVTTELALIVGWCALECALIEALATAGALGVGATAICAGICGLCALASLGCYLAYYRLRPYPAYFVAMAPIGLIAAAMIVVNCLAG